MKTRMKHYTMVEALPALRLKMREAGQTSVSTTRFALWVLLAAAASGCSSFQRSAQSGYASYGLQSHNHKPANLSQTHQSDRNTLGQGPTSPAFTDSRSQLQAVLRRLEKAIESQHEKVQYYRIRHLLSSDLDRVQYLQLGRSHSQPEAAQARFLKERGIEGDSVEFTPEVKGLIESGDIALGMSKNAVRAAWGPPEEIDVAGNPIYGNEIWHYSEQITSQDGYNSEHRKVTFEGGIVVGWQRN